VSEWIYFIHPPRDDFAATMTERERDVFAAHFEYLKKLRDDGVLILAGPTLGRTNTGIAVFRATDEARARKVMEADPVFVNEVAAGELREFRVSLLGDVSSH